jgi:hypothetical protein
VTRQWVGAVSGRTRPMASAVAARVCSSLSSVSGAASRAVRHRTDTLGESVLAKARYVPESGQPEH